MILNIKDLNKAFLGVPLFQNLEMQVYSNEKVAIIGENGVGKSTLFRILSDLESKDSGSVFWKSNIKVAFLDQLHNFTPEDTVESFFMVLYEDVKRLEIKLLELEQTMKTDSSEKVLNQYASIQEMFIRKNGYTLEHEIKNMLTRFGFSEKDLHRSLTTFSGGQLTRLSFIRLLLSKPDVLFLDEPTNHLDIQTIEWLEGYLKNYDGTVVIISHDRLFIDRICNVIVEIEHLKATRYKTNYSNYLIEKEKNIDRHNTLFAHQQKEIERLETLIEKFRYKKNKAAFAQSKIKYLDRMDRMEKIKDTNETFKASFEINLKGGNEVLVLDNYKVGYDKPLFSLSTVLVRQHRYAIYGENGAGKSTLLKSIAGKLPSLGGEIEFGHQIEMGYFDQQLTNFNLDLTIIEEVINDFPNLTNTQVRSALAQFLFKGEEVFKDIKVLSGGERVRLALVKLMLSKYNFLILDEPTNHLDIAGKEALEKALENYPGTLLFVSHDRYFVEKMSTDVFIIENGEISHTTKNVMEIQEESRKEIVEKKEKKNLDYKQIKSMQNKQKRLEESIAELEEDLESHRELRFDPDYYHDYEKMNDLNQAIDDIINEIKTKEKEWEETAIFLEENNN